MYTGCENSNPREETATMYKNQSYNIIYNRTSLYVKHQCNYYTKVLLFIGTLLRGYFLLHNFFSAIFETLQERQKRDKQMSVNPNANSFRYLEGKLTSTGSIGIENEFRQLALDIVFKAFLIKSLEFLTLLHFTLVNKHC